MRQTDPEYLLKEQYATSSNLDARIALHLRFGVGKIGWQQWLFDQIAPVDRAHVLEIGCGTAKLWADNGDRIHAGWKILLTDFSPGMLEKAQLTLADLSIPFQFDRVDVQEIPYPDDRFDIVFAHFMLYHVPDRERAIREIRRVLRPGGTLYAATNGAGHMREIHELESQFFGKPPSMTNEPFSLENGGGQLSAAFPSVELRRLEDGLFVTEVEPLVAYLLSMQPDPPSETMLESLRTHLTRTIEQDGGVRIQKDSGVFIAR